MSEDATGIVENPRGIGKMYAGAINRKGHVTEGEYEVDQQKAMDYLLEGGEIVVPNAGAGSYGKVFEALGFKDWDDFETTSSAGDWTLVVFDGEMWFPAFQSNRYPRCGFSYSVDFLRGWETKEEAFECMDKEY